MLLVLLLACGGADEARDRLDDPVPVDLTAALGPGEVRAGVVTDPAALFGGTSAEGRPGDIKMYNDRVQFVVQGVRSSSFYVAVGGTVIDADVIRPDEPGHPGHDPIDEFTPMFGLGRVLSPTSVEVVSDGSDGEAVVRVTGVEAPLGLIEGALEAPGFVPPYGLEVTTEYRLEADSWLLEVRSTATATDQGVDLALGDLAMVAPEVTDAWRPGGGLAGGGDDPFLWTGFQGRDGAPSLALVAAPGQPLTAAGAELLTELAEMAVGFGPTVSLEPGDSTAWVRYLGVAPDLATLSDAAYALAGTPVERHTGQVNAPDGPVAGVPVSVSVDDAPLAIAVTDADGRYGVDVPVGSRVAAIADGRGSSLFLDIPPGTGPYAPYVDPAVRAAQLATFAGEGFAGGPRGRGIGAEATPLELGLPATLTVRAREDLPFAVRLTPVDPEPAIDESLLPDRPSGYTAAGWSRDGTITLMAEPGVYTLTTWRGLRFGLDEQQVALGAGDETVVDVSMPKQIDHPGWILGDPHLHGAPSNDSDTPMVDRLVGAAAVGLQVHFGTDHDHVADYRPLVDALGLTPHLRSVVADEVSPPLRGHFNIYPVEPSEEANGGAWSWWTDLVESTDGLVDVLRQRHGDGFVLQSNHPTDSGLADLARWSVGVVGAGDRWTERFGAVEALNAGDHDEFTAFYLDMINRGVLVAPTGVSDAHGHFSGDVGLSATWFGVGSDDVADWSDAGLVEAVDARRTIATLGVFLATSEDPGATLSSGAVVDVEARTADWIVVDRLHLLQDGVVVETVEGTAASFVLDPVDDASFVVMAEGDTPMTPITGRTPWALTSAWLVDVDGDGWTPPLGPIVAE